MPSNLLGMTDLAHAHKRVPRSSKSSLYKHLVSLFVGIPNTISGTMRDLADIKGLYGGHSMSVSGILEQSCGDATFMILPPTANPLNPRNHLLTPICGPTTGDMYSHQDLLHGANLFCDFMNFLGGVGWLKFAPKEKIVRDLVTHNFASYPRIHPIPGKGLESNNFRIDLDVDILGCEATMEAPSFTSILPRDMCMQAVMTLIDGCEYSPFPLLMSSY